MTPPSHISFFLSSSQFLRYQIACSFQSRAPLFLFLIIIFSGLLFGSLRLSPPFVFVFFNLFFSLLLNFFLFRYNHTRSEEGLGPSSSLLLIIWSGWPARAFR